MQTAKSQKSGIGPATREVQGLLTSLNDELARMPGFKTGTPWHLDRVRSKQGLLARLETLRNLNRES